MRKLLFLTAAFLFLKSFACALPSYITKTTTGAAPQTNIEMNGAFMVKTSTNNRTNLVVISSTGGYVGAYGVSAATFTSTGGAKFATVSGNVGIGVSDPQYTLDVNAPLNGIKLETGSAGMSVMGAGLGLSSTGTLTVPGYLTMFNNPQTGIHQVIFGYSDPNNPVNTEELGIGAFDNRLDIHMGNNSLDKITFSTTSNNNSIAMVFTNSGNLGIGTQSPTEKLFVVGNSSTSGNSYVTGYVQIGNPSSAAMAPVTFGDSFPGSIARRIALRTYGLVNDHQYEGFGFGDGKIIVQLSGNTQDILFRYGVSSSTSTEMMIIKGTGNVGIGTVTPTVQLHTTGGVRFQNFGAGAATFDANGVVSSVSDIRVKTSTSNFTRGLSDLNGIVPIKYKIKQEFGDELGMDTENFYTGFSAQNVKESLPEAVFEKKGKYSLWERAIIATLVNSVKELNQEIKNLKNRIDVLEGN